MYACDERTKYEGCDLNVPVVLLRETHWPGMACQNIQPENPQNISFDPQFIGNGSDILPPDESEIERMCRRLYPTHWFPFR